MDNFPISRTDKELHIEGFPDAVKVIRLDSPQAQRLSDMSLHKSDLEFAEACLNALNSVSHGSEVLRESLWRSAIVYYSKCFGNSGARFQLNAQRIYKTEPPEAMLAFNFFKELRNRHIVHDENSYAQSLPGAVLNGGDKAYKIEKIICLNAVGVTLDQRNYDNLRLLIGKALAWVDSEFEQLCDILTKELEQLSYETLIARESITYRVPSVEEISNNRKSKK